MNLLRTLSKDAKVLVIPAAVGVITLVIMAAVTGQISGSVAVGAGAFMLMFVPQVVIDLRRGRAAQQEAIKEAYRRQQAARAQLRATTMKFNRQLTGVAEPDSGQLEFPIT